VILDTNALSAFADGDAVLLEVLKAEAVSELSLPVIVLGEYRFGIRGSRYRRTYEKWLSAMLADCSVLPVLDSTTPYYAGICQELRDAGRPIPTNDLWIAALCREHQLPLVSRDVHFDVVPGLRRLGW